jgi:hypothetical protein
LIGTFLAFLIGVCTTSFWHWRAPVEDFLSHIFLYYQD